MDYRELLKKYINHVGASEGVDFLSVRDDGAWTDDEWAALQELREDRRQP